MHCLLGQSSLNFIKKKNHAFETYWFTRFPPFSTMFSKGFFLWVIKTLDCVVKGETSLLSYDKFIT